jgi:hypothetical protein
MVTSEALALHLAGIRCPNFVDARIGEARLGIDMKTLNFQIVPLPTEVAEAARRAAAAGAPDHGVVIADSPNGFPCRHCCAGRDPVSGSFFFVCSDTAWSSLFGERADFRSRRALRTL